MPSQTTLRCCHGAADAGMGRTGLQGTSPSLSGPLCSSGQYDSLPLQPVPSCQDPCPRRKKEKENNKLTPRVITLGTIWSPSKRGLCCGFLGSPAGALRSAPSFNSVQWERKSGARFLILTRSRTVLRLILTMKVFRVLIRAKTLKKMQHSPHANWGGGEGAHIAESPREC